VKKLLLAVAVLCLVGCATSVPVVMKFPDAPKDMLETCPDLDKVDEKTAKLSDILDTVTGNYQKYYDCKATVDDWITWYQGQKKIFESVK
jgi:hypothetical protein